MALVKFESKKDKPWNERDLHATRHKVPDDIERPRVDYQKLKELLAIDGLRNRNNGETSEAAHAYFMENYKKMFVEESPKKGIPYHTLDRNSKRTSTQTIASNTSTLPNIGNTKKSLVGKKEPVEAKEPSHDISDYLGQLHKSRKSEHQRGKSADGMKVLRKLLKKLPFERTAAETDAITAAVKQNFPMLEKQVGSEVLRELCVAAQLDAWKEVDITLFGNTGMHFILKGTVQAMTDPWVKKVGETLVFRSPTPEPNPAALPKLTIGSAFGTLEKVEGREANSRILTVQTLDANCEFMKISTSDYTRVIQQIKQRDETEKVNLMQSCKTFKYWSKQPLTRVANILKWETFPPNTVIVSEGYKSPFAAIVKSGECHVLRKVEVLKDLPNGKKERKLKQVVMGKLGACDSFGEISIINNEPITCSIITATHVNMACIDPEKLNELDDTTIQLLLHSSERTFGDLNQHDIHEEYVSQEMKREWNEFKHNVVIQTINKTGIRPGYGKWAK